MNYILESTYETNRLELQAKQKAYSLEEEMKGIQICDGMSILDAGCGSGLLSRYLSDRNTIKSYACDSSKQRLAQAQMLSEGYNIEYFESDLLHIECDQEQMDLVICRYVFEYLEKPIDVCREFYRVLKNNGKAWLIDTDGSFVNIYSGDIVLDEMLNKLKVAVPGLDLYAGRKLPSYLVAAGFKNVSWDASIEIFTGDELESEKRNNIERLSQAKSLVDEMYGERGGEFCERYINAMESPGTTLFLNKFIAGGTK